MKPVTPTMQDAPPTAACLEGCSTKAGKSVLTPPHFMRAIWRRHNRMKARLVKLGGGTLL